MKAARFCGLRLPRNFLHFFQLNRAACNIFWSVDRETARWSVLLTHCPNFFSVQPLPGKSCVFGSVVIVSMICFVSVDVKGGSRHPFDDTSAPPVRVRYSCGPNSSHTRRNG